MSYKQRLPFWKKASLWVVLQIRICMDPHGFGLLDPHPESAFQMRIPEADADPEKAT
jgi:hypothetical protein